MQNSHNFIDDSEIFVVNFNTAVMIVSNEYVMIENERLDNLTLMAVSFESGLTLKYLDQTNVSF